jgi:hypothetical protein
VSFPWIWFSDTVPFPIIAKMPGNQGLHWTAPTTMVVCLVFGTLMALGHHLFYRSLVGQPASTIAADMLGFSISNQQVNLAIGSIFALLSKTGCLVAISVAFSQGFWHAALHNRKRLTLSHLDSMFYAFDSILTFTQVGLWVKHPVLFLMLIIAW